MHIENLEIGSNSQLLADEYRSCAVITVDSQLVVTEAQLNKLFSLLHGGDPDKKPFFPFTHAHLQAKEGMRVVLFKISSSAKPFWANVRMNELHAQPATIFELLPLQHILPEIFQDEYVEIFGIGSKKIQEFGVVHYPALFINRKHGGSKAYWTLAREYDGDDLCCDNGVWAAVVKENWRPLKLGDRVHRAIDPLQVVSCGEMFPIDGEVIGFTKDYTQQVQAIIQTKGGDRRTCYVSNLVLENETRASCENQTSTEPAFTVGDWVMVDLDENTKNWMRGKGAFAGGVMRIRTLWRNYGVNPSFPYGDWMATLEEGTSNIGGYQTSVSNLKPMEYPKDLPPEQELFVMKKWQEFMEPLRSQ